jgi:hypothetical protein
MNGLAHIFLHVGLCSAVEKLPSQAIVPMHVRMLIPHGDPPYDQILNVPRGDGREEVVEFDVNRGTYHLTIEVPKYSCRSSNYIMVLGDQNRKVNATLVDGSTPIEPPTLLLDGTAPISFQYTKPTYVLFDKSVVCKAPIGTPLPSHIDVDYDQGAYYFTMYADPSLYVTPPVFALRFRTPTGLAHYVRLPIHLPTDAAFWPFNIEFDISEDMVDALATEQTDVLLCPKIWGTSAG